jgi:RHS repeat-associated protein
MGETRFVYDGYVLMLEESVQSGQGTAYLYGNGALALARPLNAAHAAAELAYHDDGRGNVVNLSDVAGLPRGAIGYDAFGRANAPAGLEQQAVSFLGKFGVRAEESMTDLYLMGFRYYDASTGRFLSRDPWPGNVSRPLSLNSYAYALNNPLRYADPSGLKPCDARLKVDPFSPDTQLTHLGPALTDEELVEAIKSAYDAVLQVNAEKGRMQVKTPHDDAIAKAEAEDRKQGNALRIRRPVDPLTSAQLDTLAAHWMWVAGSLNADLVSRGGRRIMPPWKVPYPVKGPARPPDSPPALHPRARVLSNFLRWGGKPGFIHVGMRLDNVMNDPQQGGP